MWMGSTVTDFTHTVQGYFTSTGAIIWFPHSLQSNTKKYIWKNDTYLQYVLLTKPRKAQKTNAYFSKYYV